MRMLVVFLSDTSGVNKETQEEGNRDVLTGVLSTSSIRSRDANSPGVSLILPPKADVLSRPTFC
jgi:hypothetical protein